ncbi:MAG: DMT family transporter [Chloroflexota bacterium]|nr:DMT family transporter [Chloroflexota bacterium]
MNDSQSPPFPPWLVLVAGVLAVSTASTFIRLAQADIDSLAVAAWRLTLAAGILAPFALLTRRDELRSLSRREWLLALGAGLLLALHFAAWITSLALTSVAASVVLVTTSPFFVGGISHLFLGEKLSRPLLLGMSVALAGSVIIGWGDAGGGAHRLTGDLLALVGALAAAGYFVIGRRLRRRLSLVGYVFPVYGTAAIALLLMASLAQVPLSGYGESTWVWLLLLALVPQLIGHSSLNWALGHLPATYVSLAVLGEPLGSILLAWIVLSESPTASAVCGGALIMAGLVIAGRP